jgi:trimethyllysine dioxygenase
MMLETKQRATAPVETVLQAMPVQSAPLLRSARIIDGEVEVCWQGRPGSARFAPFWLRDHCHGAESLNPDTLQRQVDTFAIPTDIAPAVVALADEGRNLRIVWAHDGSSSVLPSAFLWEVDRDDGRERAPARRLWDRSAIGERLPSISHAEIMANDAGLLRWLSLVEEYGFALATDMPTTFEATRDLVTRIGYVRQTIFGGMWDFTANLAFQDTAYTSAAIGPHTDGTYSNDPPGFQLFHCLKFDGTGGESTLVDGFRVAEYIRSTDVEAFEALTTTPVPAHYLGDGVHLRAEHPVIGVDRDGALRQIAYNNYDRAPFRLPAPRMRVFYRALKLFNELINDGSFEITMRLLPGTALLFDNWRTLHGRRAYQGHRWLCGAYLNQEDFASKLRVLKAVTARERGVG